MYAATTNKAMSKEEMQDRIRSIIYVVYHNIEYFDERYRNGLKDEIVRKIVQLAIWKITDGYNIDSDNSYNLNATEKQLNNYIIIY